MYAKKIFDRVASEHRGELISRFSTDNHEVMIFAIPSKDNANHLEVYTRPNRKAKGSFSFQITFRDSDGKNVENEQAFSKEFVSSLFEVGVARRTLDKDLCDPVKMRYLAWAPAQFANEASAKVRKTFWLRTQDQE